MKYTLTIESSDADELVRLLTGGKAEMRFDAATGPLQPSDGDGELAALAQPEPQQTAQTTPPMPTTTGQTDADNLPWDERIHASSKALNADGTWRRRRGVSDNDVAAVEKELRDGSADEPAQPQAQEPMWQEEPQQAAQVTPPMPTAQPQQSTPPMPTSQPEPQQAAPAEHTFSELMNAVARGFQNKTIDQDYLGSLVKDLDIGNITEVSTDPSKLKDAIDQLKQDGKWS